MPGDDADIDDGASAEVETDALHATVSSTVQARPGDAPDVGPFQTGEDDEARSLLSAMMDREAILESGSADDQFRHFVLGQQMDRERPRTVAEPDPDTDMGRPGP